MRAAVMQNFGKYEIVSKIGEGGFGVVYEAFDPRIARRVAIKTCPTDDARLRQRFLHEARISGSLHHRNIIVVYDYGEEGDTPYLVQEFLTGEDLDRKISRGDELPLETKIDYLAQAAEGLHYAHTQGIIHRDVKPSNLRVLDDGQIKVMDFGIAKLRDSELALTLPGQTVGTPAYLAPEQIRSLELDSRADVYAFGLLGYELLTYRKAYPSRNASRVLYQILNEEPDPLAEVWPECPPELAAILERCYRKDRDERWSSLEEVALALRGVLEGLAPPRGRPAGAARSNAVAHDSETMVTPGGTLQDARRAIQQAAGQPQTAGSASLDVPIGAGAAEGGRRSEATSLDDLALGGLGSDRVPVPGDAGPGQSPPRAARGRVVGILIAVAVLAIAGWLGLRLLDLGGEEPEASPGAATAEALPDFEPVPDEGSAAAADAQTATADTLPPPSRPPASEPESPSGSTPSPSVLLLRASWDPTMTAAVGDREPVLLDQDRSFEIPPGEDLRVTFTSGRSDYPVAGTVEVTGESGRRTVIESPIQPPGALTIRAGLGAPGLHVTLDGEALGWTPIDARLVAPGPHSVVVASDDSEEPEAQRSYDFELTSQEEVVLTFDLRRSTPSVARRPYRD